MVCYVATRFTLQHVLLCRRLPRSHRITDITTLTATLDADEDVHAVCRMLQLHDLATLIATLDADRDGRISLRELRHESLHFSRFNAALTAALSAVHRSQRCAAS